MNRPILTFGAAIAGLTALSRASFAQTQAPANPPMVDVVLVLDNSASMASRDPSFLLRAAASRFAQEMRPADRFSAVIFGDGSRLALPLKANTDADFGQALEASLKLLDYKEQYTDIPGGFATALYELRENGRRPAQHAIVLVTDGFVDLRDRAQIAGRKQWLQQDLRREAEGSVRVFGIAFTATADLQLLQSLATGTGGDYRQVRKAYDLLAALGEIRAEILRPPKAPAKQREPGSDPGGQSEPRPSSRGAVWFPVTVGFLAVLAVGIVAIAVYRGLLKRSRAAEMVPEKERGFLRRSPVRAR